MTELSKYEFSRKENAVFYSCLAAAGLIISYLMYRNIMFSAVIIPFAPRIKGFVTDSIIKRRRRRYMAEFKDFLFMASTAIGAGRSMKDAIAESVPSLLNIYGKRAILAGDLSKAYERMETGGENDVSVLRDLADASGLDLQDHRSQSYNGSGKGCGSDHGEDEHRQGGRRACTQKGG